MKQQDPRQLAQYSDTYIAFVGDILHIKAAGKTLAELHDKLKEKTLLRQPLPISRRLIKPSLPYASNYRTLSAAADL